MNDPRAQGLSRRDFLGKGGAIAVGAALASSGIPSAFAAGNPYGGFRLGIQSYSLRSFPFAQAVEKTKKLGLHHIELYPGHVGHKPPFQVDKAVAKQMLADARISADAYGVVPFSKDEKSAREVFEFARFMGLRSISADPDKDSFDMLDKLVEEYRISVAIHNHGPGNRYEKPEIILAAVKDHHKFIGACVDCGHYLRSGIDPVAATKMLKGRVFGFHIKDFVDVKTEVSAGDGKLNIAELLKEARDQNFHGACSIEYELDPKDPIAGIEKGIENFKKAVAALPKAAGKPSE